VQSNSQGGKCYDEKTWFRFRCFTDRSCGPSGRLWREIGKSASVVARDGDEFDAGSFHWTVIGVPGHTTDSLAFLTGSILFTGDALSAGLVGSTSSSYAAVKQARSLRSNILTLSPQTIIMPGHGPPTSVKTEKQFNAGLSHHEEKMRNVRRKPWRVDLLT
jgi:glyoxylase-like metal-dependent hydrolase (beta-lactamase superfamily II)